jgi:hypothetical protein
LFKSRTSHHFDSASEILVKCSHAKKHVLENAVANRKKNPAQALTCGGVFSTASPNTVGTLQTQFDNPMFVPEQFETLRFIESRKRS